MKVGNFQAGMTFRVEFCISGVLAWFIIGQLLLLTQNPLESMFRIFSLTKICTGTSYRKKRYCI
jgi:hypothetical protein